MNRVDRLLATILLLQGRRVTRAEDIARHFEISLRTVYRDIAALGEAGVPIVAEAGVGYALMRGYHLPPVSFTDEEANALATGGMLVRQFAGDSLEAPITSALLKIRAVLPREKQDQLARLETSMTALANSDRGAAGSLVEFQRALAEQRVVHICYQSPERPEVSERDIEPLGLVHYRERWHLIAWCRMRTDYRDFRTDRIRSFSILAEKFRPHENFSLDAFVRVFAEPGQLMEVRVLFAPKAADRAKRQWLLGIRATEQTERGVILTLAASELDWLVCWLLSFGRDAVVIEPAELAARLVHAAEDLAAHHAIGLSAGVA